MVSSWLRGRRAAGLSVPYICSQMSESRPLADTLPQPEATSCPLFADGPETRAPNWTASTFGLGVHVFLLAEASYRLGERALSTVHEGLNLQQYALLALSIVLFGYGEGYRALHRRFVPHVIGRAIALAHRERRGVRDYLAAPLYVMGLVQAERRTLLRAWLGVALIVSAIFIVRAMPEPYRGIVDAGVAVALCIGLGSMIAGYVAAVRSKRG
jgi:hypothetical protein